MVQPLVCVGDVVVDQGQVAAQPSYVLFQRTGWGDGMLSYFCRYALFTRFVGARQQLQ